MFKQSRWKYGARPSCIFRSCVDISDFIWLNNQFKEQEKNRSYSSTTLYWKCIATGTVNLSSLELPLPWAHQGFCTGVSQLCLLCIIPVLSQLSLRVVCDHTSIHLYVNHFLIYSSH